jgi:hypothetical protein
MALRLTRNGWQAQFMMLPETDRTQQTIRDLFNDWEGAGPLVVRNVSPVLTLTGNAE